jgi:hypothetical protein
MDDARRVVWVLGSGFSAPLGGPMLAQLLSTSLHEEVAHRYANCGVGNPIMVDLLRLYHYGRGFATPGPEWLWPSGSPALRGEHLSEHAEDFLDALDTCAADANEAFGNHLGGILNKYYVVSPHTPPSLAELSLAARKHIAAECCSFLERNSAAKERWAPHRRWAEFLVGPNDTIITFNYDCVLEMLNERKEFVDIVIDFSDETERIVKAYKLHGSTSWVGQKADDARAQQNQCS